MGFNYGYRYKCDNTGCLAEEFISTNRYPSFEASSLIKAPPRGWYVIYDSDPDTEPLTFCSSICVAAYYSGEKFQEKGSLDDPHQGIRNPDVERLRENIRKEKEGELTNVEDRRGNWGRRVED